MIPKPHYCVRCHATDKVLQALAILVAVFFVAVVAKADPVSIAGPTCASIGIRAEFNSVPTLAQWAEVVGIPRERVAKPYAVVLSPERSECVDELVLGLRKALTDSQDLNGTQADEIALLKSKFDAEHLARLRAEEKASRGHFWRNVSTHTLAAIGGGVAVEAAHR